MGGTPLPPFTDKICKKVFEVLPYMCVIQPNFFGAYTARFAGRENILIHLTKSFLTDDPPHKKLYNPL